MAYSSEIVEREHKKRLAKLNYEQFFLLDAQVVGASSASSSLSSATAQTPSSSAPSSFSSSVSTSSSRATTTTTTTTNAQKEEELSFGVSGSTGNIYRVTIDAKTRRFNCLCPDFTSHARNFGVECKHCLFVAHRAMRSSLPDEHFQRNHRKIPRALYEAWRAKTAQIQTLLSSGDRTTIEQQIGDAADGNAIVNVDYVQRYKASASGQISAAESGADSNSTNSVNNVVGVVRAHLFTGRGADEECPICFEPIVNPEKKNEQELVVCHVCTRAVHRDCCNQWISTGKHDSCVYCRTPLQYSIEERGDGGEGKRKSRRTLATTTYTNVADL